MARLIHSASLCPIRIRKELEVLLTRRAFWNNEKNRPMRYPGEWVFAGGSYENKDNNLIETAIREFREELNYKNNIENVKFLRSGYQRSHEKKYYVEFYAASIEDSEFKLTEEIIEFKWISPESALNLIKSKEFTENQLKKFKQYGLTNRKYGIYRVNQRQFPVQNVKTLELINSMSELRGLYGKN